MPPRHAKPPRRRRCVCVEFHGESSSLRCPPGECVSRSLWEPKSNALGVNCVARQGARLERWEPTPAPVADGADLRWLYDLAHPENPTRPGQALRAMSFSHRSPADAEAAKWARRLEGSRQQGEKQADAEDALAKQLARRASGNDENERPWQGFSGERQLRADAARRRIASGGRKKESAAAAQKVRDAAAAVRKAASARLRGERMAAAQARQRKQAAAGRAAVGMAAAAADDERVFGKAFAADAEENASQQAEAQRAGEWNALLERAKGESARARHGRAAALCERAAKAALGGNPEPGVHRANAGRCCVELAECLLADERFEEAAAASRKASQLYHTA